MNYLILYWPLDLPLEATEKAGKSWKKAATSSVTLSQDSTSHFTLALQLKGVYIKLQNSLLIGKSWKISYVNQMLKNICIQNIMKKSSFFSGPATKRVGGGVRDWPLRKKNLFLKL